MTRQRESPRNRSMPAGSTVPGNRPWSRSKWTFLGLALGVLITALIIWPLGELFAVAADQVGSPADLDGLGPVLVNTILVGLLTAAVALVLGAGAALMTERAAIPGRRWLRLGILLPILVPPFVSALSWTRAYGQSGLVDDLLGLRFPGLFGLGGIVVVVALNAVPIVYLLTVAALNSRVERDLEQAARVSGATPLAAARTITLPLLAPVLAGTGALVFVFGINAFGVPAILGTPAGFRTVTTTIYEELALSARPESFRRAVLLATGLVIIALIFVLIAESLLGSRGRAERTSSATGPVMKPAKTRLGLAVSGWGFVLLTTVVPLVALILASVTKGVGLSPSPQNLTLGNYGEALDGRLAVASMRSVGLAVLAATIAVILGGAVSALRHRRFGRLSGVAVLLTFAVPGSTLAVAMILSYGSILRDTLLLILIAYVSKLWAVGHRAIAGSVENLAPQLYFAARVNGASSVTAVRTVLIPLLRPALFGGWFLVFLVAFHELTMSSLLYGPGTETLAVSVLNLTQIGDVPVSSALAVLLTIPLLLLAVPFLVVGRLPRRFLGTG